MDETAARARLTRMVAAAKEPKLDDSALDDLVALAQRADAAGVAPSDPAWVPTWDLNAAAAEGWRWKAAKAVGLSASAPGEEQRFDFTQRECLAMADSYAKRTRARSVRVLTVNGDPTLPSSP